MQLSQSHKFQMIFKYFLSYIIVKNTKKPILYYTILTIKACLKEQCEKK